MKMAKTFDILLFKTDKIGSKAIRALTAAHFGKFYEQFYCERF